MQKTMGELKTSSPMASGEASVSSSGYQTAAVPVAALPPKKKRNLPGMPDPDAEVIALSPKTLLATNRFVCEICNKGFQRDQNLQLHRRGHNLPWKLRQRTTKEVRKRVYVCPEPSCVHHNPARALGDLTGIKKHFCRKHGEKKWKCERCSKKYAVQSDWKAHMKTCGTREYKCDCGTLFSRRDSFITHRAFCDALAEESARSQTLAVSTDVNNPNAKVVVASPPPPPLTPSTTVVSPALSIQSSELPENAIGLSPPTPATTCLTTSTTTANTSCSSSNGNTTSTVFASIFAPSSAVVTQPPPPPPPPPPQTSSATSISSFPNLIPTLGRSHRTSTSTTALVPTVPIQLEPTSLSLSTSLYLSNNVGSSLFPTPPDHHDQHRHFALSPQQPAMSATALLQKAAQMGAAASNASLLCSFGLTTSSAATGKEHAATNTAAHWNSQIKPESGASATGLALGLAENSGLTDLVMGPSSLFGNQAPMTRDLLGLSIGGGGGESTGGLSALLNSFGGGGGFESSYGGEGQPERKPNGPALL